MALLSLPKPKTVTIDTTSEKPPLQKPPPISRLDDTSEAKGADFLKLVQKEVLKLFNPNAGQTRRPVSRAFPPGDFYKTKYPFKSPFTQIRAHPLSTSIQCPSLPLCINNGS
jgi:hypothetical protein